MTPNAKHALLDTLIERMKLKNDARLADALEMDSGQISKIRHRKLPVGAVIQLRIHEASGMAFSEILELAAA